MNLQNEKELYGDFDLKSLRYKSNIQDCYARIHALQEAIKQSYIKEKSPSNKEHHMNKLRLDAIMFWHKIRDGVWKD